MGDWRLSGSSGSDCWSTSAFLERSECDEEYQFVRSCIRLRTNSRPNVIKKGFIWQGTSIRCWNDLHLFASVAIFLLMTGAIVKIINMEPRIDYVINSAHLFSTLRETTLEHIFYCCEASIGISKEFNWLVQEAYRVKNLPWKSFKISLSIYFR